MLLCLNCDKLFKEDLILSETSCPSCGTVVPPKDTDKMVTFPAESIKFLIEIAEKFVILNGHNYPSAFREELTVTSNHFKTQLQKRGLRADS